MPDLRSAVDKKLASFGLLDSSQTSDSEDSDKSIKGNGIDISSRPKKSAKSKLKSGLFQKSSDSVLFPQIWPHTALHVSESVDFMALDIKMIVAGELEIIMGKRTSSVERTRRLRFGGKNMYFASIYEWSALLRFYAARLRKIEVGLNTWSDDSSEIETPMLARYTLRGKTPDTV